ncbi:MAG: NAD(P)H-dependent oxidoreductase subunit E [Myxococcota bacterium]
MVSPAQPNTDLPGDGWRMEVDRLIEVHVDDLLGLLLDINQSFGFLPRNVLAYVSDKRGVPVVRLFGIASFYRTFRLEPRGRHTISVCQGTACHVAGGASLASALTRRLGVEPGRTAPDGTFTLESVACIGCCSLAPVIQLNGETRGRVKNAELLRMVSTLQAET